MKKWINFLCVAILMLILVGCNATTTSEAANESEPTATPIPTATTPTETASEESNDNEAEEVVTEEVIEEAAEEASTEETSTEEVVETEVADAKPEFDPDAPPATPTAGELWVLAVPLAVPSKPGELQPDNAAYVLETLRHAVAGCQQGLFQAMVTAPVQKSTINDAGIPFTGHTEYLAELTNAERAVMMLATDHLRVALVTTHLPLAQVLGSAHLRG